MNQTSPSGKHTTTTEPSASSAPKSARTPLWSIYRRSDGLLDSVLPWALVKELCGKYHHHYVALRRTKGKRSKVQMRHICTGLIATQPELQSAIGLLAVHNRDALASLR